MPAPASGGPRSTCGAPTTLETINRRIGQNPGQQPARWVGEARTFERRITGSPIDLQARQRPGGGSEAERGARPDCVATRLAWQGRLENRCAATRQASELEKP